MSLVHYLGQPGPVQLIKSGAIQASGTDNFLAASLFSPLCLDQGRYRRLRAPRPILRWVPLAHTLALPLGAGLVQGIPTHVGGVEPFWNVRVRAGEGTPGSRRRAALDQAGLLPHALPYYAEELEAQVNWSWWYEYESLDSRFDHVLAPATTVFNTYYAPTSQMATLVLKNDLEVLLRGLERSDAYVDRTTGVSHLRLGRERHTSEVPLLSRALFDPTGVARARAISIGGHAALSARSGEPRCIKAEPPFDGETTMTVYGRLHMRGKQRILLVTQIIECNHPFPFEKLNATVDQPGKSSGERSSKCGGGRIRLDKWDFDLEELDGTGDRPGTEHLPVTALVLAGTRLTAFNKHNVLIGRRDVNRNGKGPGKTPLSPAPRNSSQRRHGKGDSDARQVHTSTQSQTIAPEKKKDDHKGLSPAEALRLTLEELQAFTMATGATLESVVLTDARLKYGPWIFNVVHQEGKGRRKSWMRIHHSNKPRGILIVHASLHGLHAYVLEVLRQADEAYATLVLCSSDGSEISVGVMQGIFDRIDESQSLPKSERIKSSEEIEITRVKHWADASERRRLSTVLRDVLGS
ncbi:hypothetical protein SAMN04487939_12137 [Lysobacter sp. yr284]|uniref:hypothetical protein n=1 Tax=Lysobacter sp. yr284 TaxID=1761791 RepID=UPI00089962D5|nr:hypothetical protein [Lysobacter sp. yr284]SDZ18798.1 hypothetical protein SAMN04487939_12137 [Lysobacter sp. yr284]